VVTFIGIIVPDFFIFQLLVLVLGVGGGGGGRPMTFYLPPCAGGAFVPAFREGILAHY